MIGQLAIALAEFVLDLVGAVRSISAPKC